MLVALLTVFTLLAFAANSVLCRIALGAGLIDPVSFTSLRLVSGAVILAPLARLVTEPAVAPQSVRSWISGLALFIYACAFSLAYAYLDTGMGALILFGSVQATMIGVGLKSGERPHLRQYLGLAAALGGLIFLVSPGITAPDPLGALLMSISGIAWGFYSLRGKNVMTPISSSAGNFLRTVPMAITAAVIAFWSLHATETGIVLSLISGTLTSGLAYVLWYRVVRLLTTTTAAIVQLLVPVLAASGGVLLLDELVSVRLVIASALVLGGVGLALIGFTQSKDFPECGPTETWRPCFRK